MTRLAGPVLLSVFRRAGWTGIFICIVCWKFYSISERATAIVATRVAVVDERELAFWVLCLLVVVWELLSNERSKLWRPHAKGERRTEAP